MFLSISCSQEKIYYTISQINNINIYIEKDGRLVKNQNGSLNKNQEFYVWLIVDNGFALNKNSYLIINNTRFDLIKHDGQSFKSESVKIKENFSITLHGEVKQTEYMIENIVFSCEDQVLEKFMLRFDDNTMQKLNLDYSMSLLDFKNLYKSNSIPLIYHYGDELEIYLYAVNNVYQVDIDMELTDLYGNTLYNFGKGFNHSGELQFTVWFIGNTKNIIMEFK